MSPVTTLGLCWNSVLFQAKKQKWKKKIIKTGQRCLKNLNKIFTVNETLTITVTVTDRGQNPSSPLWSKCKRLPRKRWSSKCLGENSRTLKRWKFIILLHEGATENIIK